MVIYNPMIILILYNLWLRVKNDNKLISNDQYNFKIKCMSFL